MWQSTKINQIDRVTTCVYHKDSCHSYTYVGSNREVHKNFVMWFVTWEAWSTGYASTIYFKLPSTHLVWNCNYAQKGKANIYERKRMYYYWVIFLYSSQEAIISVLYSLKLTQCCWPYGPTIQWLCIYKIVFLILDTTSMIFSQPYVKNVKVLSMDLILWIYILVLSFYIVIVHA
jgi:hypothetical protein